jgi:hypothetical protein
MISAVLWGNLLHCLSLKLLHQVHPPDYPQSSVLLKNLFHLLPPKKKKKTRI